MSWSWCTTRENPKESRRDTRFEVRSFIWACGVRIKRPILKHPNTDTRNRQGNAKFAKHFLCDFQKRDVDRWFWFQFRRGDGGRGGDHDEPHGNTFHVTKIALHWRRRWEWCWLLRRQFGMCRSLTHITLSSNTTIDKIQVHVNNMLTKDFGVTRDVKRVPAHTPLAINVEEMERLQKRYASEYRKTSSNRFRSSDDVQFAFAYFHWLILSSRHLDFEMEQFFSDVVDTNQDGHVTENEIRTVAAIVAGGAPSERDLEDTKECLRQNYENGRMIRVRSIDLWQHRSMTNTTNNTQVQPERRTSTDLMSHCQVSELFWFDSKIRDNAHLTFEPVIVESPENRTVWMIDEDLDKTVETDSIRARRPNCLRQRWRQGSERGQKIYMTFTNPSCCEITIWTSRSNEYLRLMKAKYESRGKALVFLGGSCSCSVRVGQVPYW